MDQEHTQQGEQLNNTPLEEQRLVKNDEQLPFTRGEQVPAHFCANCDIEFFWPPTVVQGKVYCCTGCAAGGPCNCDYSLYRSAPFAGYLC